MLIIILQLSTLYLLKFWWGNETNDSCICHQNPRATTIFLHKRLNIIKRDLAKKRATLDTTIKKIKAKEMMIKIWALEPTLPNTLLKIDETQAPIPLIQAKRSLSQIIIIIIFTDFSSFLFLP